MATLQISVKTKKLKNNFDFSLTLCLYINEIYQKHLKI